MKLGTASRFGPHRLPTGKAFLNRAQQHYICVMSHNDFKAKGWKRAVVLLLGVFWVGVSAALLWLTRGSTRSVEGLFAKWLLLPLICLGGLWFIYAAIRGRTADVDDTAERFIFRRTWGIEYIAWQVAGSPARMLSMLMCQVGAFILLMHGIGWRSALEFGFFMLLMPAVYLGLLYRMMRGLPQSDASVEEAQT